MGGGGGACTYSCQEAVEKREEGLELEVGMLEKIRELKGQGMILIDVAIMGGGGAMKGIVVEV